jgi:hypothetical protein
MSIVINNKGNINKNNILGLLAVLISDNCNTSIINIGELEEVKSEEECTICCENKKYSKKVKLICGHIFHKKCIEKYRKISLECPLCRVIQLKK